MDGNTQALFDEIVARELPEFYQADDISIQKMTELAHDVAKKGAVTTVHYMDLQATTGYVSLSSFHYEDSSSISIEVELHTDSEDDRTKTALSFSYDTEDGAEIKKDSAKQWDAVQVMHEVALTDSLTFSESQAMKFIGAVICSSVSSDGTVFVPASDRILSSVDALQALTKRQRFYTDTNYEYHWSPDEFVSLYIALDQTTKSDTGYIDMSALKLNLTDAYRKYVYELIHTDVSARPILTRGLQVPLDFEPSIKLPDDSKLTVDYISAVLNRVLKET